MNLLIRERWSGPGRLRLDIAPMVSNRPLAEAIKEVMYAMEDVREVKANPISGSLLVMYETRSKPADFSSRVRSEIEARLTEWCSSRHPVIEIPRSALSRILETSHRHPEEELGPALLSAGAYALMILQSLSFGSIAKVAMGGSPGFLRKVGLTGARAQLRALTAAALLLTGAELWANYVRSIAWRRLSQRIEHRLRTAVFMQIQAQDLAFFDEHGTGQLMALLTGDVGSVGALVEKSDELIESTLTIFVGGVLLLRAAPGLALSACVSIPFMLIPVRWLQPRARQAFSQKADANASLNQTLENILAGIVEVKSFTTENIEIQRFRNLSRDVAESSVRTTLLTLLQTTVAGSIFYGGYALALSYGAGRLLSQKIQEDQFTRANFWYPRLVTALGRIQDSMDTYLEARTAAERLCGVLDSKPQIRDGLTRLDPAAVRGEIVMKNVSFGYDPSIPVLRNVSFRIPPGETLGIVGPTGSGKSTLLRLLLRFYEPNSGQIFLDGHDLKDLSVNDVRAAIALVSQDVYLFNGSVRHNVAYGQPSATDDVVVEALAAAGAQELLGLLPQGLETEVGERGHRLSGGQRQRIAIARALLKAAPILALDEATSHLDYITEATVKLLTRSTSGKTVIVIAHRLSSVRDADNIIVLDQGTIREQGRHQDLLDEGGLYFDLWQLRS